MSRSQSKRSFPALFHRLVQRRKSAGNSNFQNPFCELNYFLGSEYYCTGLLCLPLYKGQTFPRKWTRPSAEFPRQVLGLHFLQRCGIASDNLWSWCKTSKICLLNFFFYLYNFCEKKVCKPTQLQASSHYSKIAIFV